MTAVTNQDGGPHHYDYAGAGQTERIRSGGRDFTTGPLGIQAVRRPSRTDYIERDPSGMPLAYRTKQGGDPDVARDWYYVRDGQGSVVAMIEPDGTLAARYTYTPYGTTLAASGDSIAGTNRDRYARGSLKS